MAGKNSKIGGGGFHHIAIGASDFDASMKFYVDGLGFVAAKQWSGQNGRAVMLDTGDGNYLEMFERPGRQAPSEGAVLHFALRTEDCDGAIERARAAGAEVTVEPKDVDIPSAPSFPVRIAFFKGPDGEIVEVFQER
jgi:glyoxylase I family protein